MGITMSKKMTLSVIMSNYNDAKTLSRAIEAIVSQSRIPNEFLIVDDGSTDESVNIIKLYADKYPWIKVYQNEKNMGIQYSINKLLNLVNGDFFYSASANDYILPDFFENGMVLAEKYPEVGVIMGEMYIEDKTGNKLGIAKISSFKRSNFYNPKAVLNNYFFKENPNHSLCGATIYKTTLAREFGGYIEELGSYCDTFIARFLALKNGMIYLAYPCMVWVMNEKSLSGSTGDDKIESFKIIENCSRLMRSEKYKNIFPDEYIEWWRFCYEHLLLIHFLGKSLAQLQVEKNLNLFPKIRNSQKFKKKILHQLIKFEIFVLGRYNTLIEKIMINT